MQLATVLRSDNGAPTAAVLVGEVWHSLDAVDLSVALSQKIALDAPGHPLPGAVPLLPLPSPSKVVCCGLNYADHIAEMGRGLPTHPTLFAKYADTLLGNGDRIIAPRGVELDWEAELAVVVGSTIRSATRDEAARAIGGYTVANDISVRDWQRRTTQWFQGKAWDATTPLGPVIVTPDELDLSSAEVVCRINGVERQRGRLAELVFDPAELLAYISTFTTLRPGDIVLTGTPGGVGMGMDPPRYLADGDVVETHITGIGTLVNRVSLI